MTDYSKAQIFSTASSNKIFTEGSGSFSVASLPGAGETFGIATIPHGYSSDELIFQVTATTNTAGTGDKSALPWSSNDNRINQYAYIDSTNLYIVCISSDSSGAGSAARTVSYYYHLLIP